MIHGGNARWVLLACVLYFALAYGVWLPLKWQRSFRQYKALQRSQKYLVTDDTLRIESESGSGIVRWDELVNWKEGNGVFLLYPSDVLFYVIPTRFFASADHVEGFRQLIARAVTK